MARILAVALILLGLVVSGYLLARSAAVADAGAHGAGRDICSAVFGATCDETLKSPLSHQLGLPLAGWGIVYYGTLAALLLLGWGVGDAFRFEATLAALVLAVAGAVASALLAATFVTGTVPFCPLCSVLQVTNLLLVFVVWRLAGCSFRELCGGLASAARYVVGAEPADPAQARWKLVGLLAAGLVAVVLYQWVYIEVAAEPSYQPPPAGSLEALIEFEKGPRQKIPVTTVDPRLGPDNAPLRLVVFSDFQCPACRRFAAQVRPLAEEFDGRLQVAFKHFPLGTDCNDALRRDLHPRACEAALAAEAAHRQDRFWEFHDAAFADGLGDAESGLADLAEKIGLDLPRFEADRAGESAAAKLQADIALGSELQVDGTPSLFLDGRRVYDLRIESLRFFVTHLLEHHQHEH